MPKWKPRMIAQTPHDRLRTALLAVTLAALVGCGGQPAQSARTAGAVYAPHGDAGEYTQIGARAARVAVRQVGTPYRYGGSSPQGFDCSGLVHFAYAEAGKRIPRTTTQLWTSVAPVQTHDLRSGDLVFFRIDGKMSHVGMYLGDGRFVHAPSSGRTVSIESLDAPFYRQAFLRAGRPY